MLAPVRITFNRAILKTAMLRTAVLSIAVSVFPGLLAAQEQAGEYDVKAAFLLNFTKFVAWPSSAFPAPDSPLRICIWGDDPFGKSIDLMVEGEKVNGRIVLVERLRRQPSQSCQIFFVTQAEKNTAEVLNALGPGVLTVGEGAKFLQEGGIVSFLIQARRVRFAINAKAAGSAGLKISSQLLKVATYVEP